MIIFYSHQKSRVKRKEVPNNRITVKAQWQNELEQSSDLSSAPSEEPVQNLVSLLISAHKAA